MGMVISETQTGFIESRNIKDRLIIANTTVNWFKKKRKSGALFNVDFKKAYDSMRWVFLEHMLNQMSFGENMIKWLM